MSMVMRLEGEVPNLVNRWWQKAEDNAHNMKCFAEVAYCYIKIGTYVSSDLDNVLKSHAESITKLAKSYVTVAPQDLSTSPVHLGKHKIKTQK